MYYWSNYMKNDPKNGEFCTQNEENSDGFFFALIKTFGSVLQFIIIIFWINKTKKSSEIS